MSSAVKMIEGVAQLVQDMELAVDDGGMRLSGADWAQLDGKLQDAYSVLEKGGDVSPRELDDVAWLVVGAFEENKRLAGHFGEQLAALTAGTKLTGRKLFHSKRTPVLTKNRMIMLSFVKRVSKEAKASQDSTQKGSRS